MQTETDNKKDPEIPPGAAESAPRPVQQKYKRLKIFVLAAVVLACLAGMLALLRWARLPLAEKLSLPGVSTPRPGESQSIQFPTPPEPANPAGQAVCGNEKEWFVLLVGLDSRELGTEYLYGMADVIRMIRVDFTAPSVNVISLPRGLLVNIPEERLLVKGPVLINEAYFYGTRGMGHYKGTAYGAGSLAETIQYNFGITSNHYLVVNFQAFVSFVDAIGGIDLDLPTYVDDMPNAYFPAGKQHLDGTQALTLARIRRKYSDLHRINDQTLIIDAILQKLKDPAILPKMPEIYASLKDAVITDFSPAQLETLRCLFSKLGDKKVSFFDPGWDLLTEDWEFIPTLKIKMQIERWDQHFVDWMYASLWSNRQ